MASRPVDVKVSVQGATGRLGTLIVKEAGPNYVGAVERSGSVPACDVVIDVSSAAGIAALLPRLSGQALVVGTTGELPMDALRAYAEHAPVAIVPNFSVGVPLLLDLVQRAVGALPPGWDIEIVEAHHHHKLDAPSGTAKRLARADDQCLAAQPREQC